MTDKSVLTRTFVFCFCGAMVGVTVAAVRGQFQDRQSRNRCWEMVRRDREAFDRAIEQERAATGESVRKAPGAYWGEVEFSDGRLRVDMRDERDAGACVEIELPDRQKVHDVGASMIRWAATQSM